ncbi:DMT family transporter [Siccirubricoccus phaeus]|uniref:DMT family transporter n=1 Tax=Siccirubricoccus phaeus TaxID=2595053 RepID=UPI0011F2595F|nr:DMT family transporter [Siccirubricoccus phaeus]
MNETIGILAAMCSSGLGGTAIAATRYLAGAADPLTIGACRFGIGFLLLAGLGAWQGGGRHGRPWPARRDWPAVAGLGLLFFGLFPVLFNASLIYTTAARAALALSTLPLLTMAAAAMLGVEALTARKSLGVAVATGGVALALLAGLGTAPDGAWRGDALMAAAALCMALYNVWSRPFIRRSGALPFTALGMGVGAAALAGLAWARGDLAALAGFGLPQWLAMLHLGLFGSALTFWLWAFALVRTTPTRVAVSVTVNPVTAALLGAVLLGEPIRWNLVLGLAAVLAGIALASTGGPRAAAG